MVKTLHPLAWWCWGICLAIAGSRTVNVWLLASIILASVVVTFSRRSNDPWAFAINISIKIALFAVSIRILIAILFSVPGDGSVIFKVPRIHLPELMAGINLGGDVTSERLQFVFIESLTIFALVITIAGASSLANPKQTLRALPGILHEAGVALIIATTLIPHFAMSVKRIRSARALRGDTRRLSLKRTLIPLFEEALERALILAESMEARGYGFHAKTKKSSAASIVMMLAMGGLLLAILLLLIGSDYQLILVSSLTMLLVGLVLANHENSRSKYRPIPWRKEEFLVIATAISSALLAGFPFSPVLVLTLFLTSSSPLLVTVRQGKVS